MSKPDKINFVKVSFFQALGLVLYCSLVGIIMLNGNSWFGTMKVAPLLGPILFLSLFIVSALICALIALSYPIHIFWDKKDTRSALKLVGYTASWLVVFVIVFILTLTFLNSR